MILAQQQGFLEPHASSITAVANIVMVLVWAVYLQLIYRRYRYQMRPRVLINLTRFGEIHLCNMGSQAIYLQCLQSLLKTDGRERLTDLTDRMNVERLNTGQGTVGAGQSCNLGSVDALLRLARKEERHSENGEQVLQLRAVVLYGSDEEPMGVSRSFEISSEEESFLLTPEQPQAYEWWSQKERATVQQWLEASTSEVRVTPGD